MKKGVLEVGSIPEAILPSCQDMRTFALYLHTYETSSGPTGLGQYNSRGEYCDPHTASSVFSYSYIYIMHFYFLNVNISVDS